MKDGGPAFPYSALAPEGPTVYKDNEGMSLRDYFAAKAMAALLRQDSWDTGCDNETAVARVAYIMADAMLKERNKEK